MKLILVVVAAIGVSCSLSGCAVYRCVDGMIYQSEIIPPNVYDKTHFTCENVNGKILTEMH